MRRQHRLRHPQIRQKFHLRQTLQRRPLRIRRLMRMRLRSQVPRPQPPIIMRRPRNPIEVDFNRRHESDTRYFLPHEAQRYKERSTAERVNARLKDEFGAMMVHVRGHAKVMTHLMFGVIALTVDQLMRFVT